MKTNLIICSLVLSLFVCNFASASPATDYSFVREFGEAGIFTNNFYKMDGIAVDRFGHVFVTDPYGFIDPKYGVTNFYLGVKRWSTDGVYEHYWTMHQGYRQLLGAWGIDCSCDGDPFYIAPYYISSLETSVLNIEHTDLNGAYYENFPDDYYYKYSGFEFRDVAISGDGFAYGILYGSYSYPPTNFPVSAVVKFSWNGSNWVSETRSVINPEDGLSAKPWGIDVDPRRGRVYVTVLSDDTNGTAGVKVYDMDLNLTENLTLWPYDAMPYGVAVDNRDGSFFVCEGVSNKIQKFTSAGMPVTSWGGPGTGESEFNRPSDLDVDMNGYVYVADADNHRVQVFAPPMEGNLNFIVFKSKVKVKWKQKAKGKDRDIIMAKGFVAVDHLTNIFGGPGSQAMVGLPISFWYGEVPVISNMTPTKTNKKGSKALYKPDKNHKAKLIYKEKGALIKFVAKLKKADVDGPLGINDVAQTALPPWLWVNAQMTLSTNYLGVHYMRLEHKNKVGKIYKAIKK